MVRDPVSGLLVDSRDGTVVEDRPIDTGPYWGDAEDAMAAPLVNAPSTFIDHAGGPQDIRRRLEALRLRKLQRIIESETEDRSVSEAREVIARVSAQAGLPRPCVDDALGIFSKAVNKGLLRGRSVEVVALACLYIACRRNGTPRSVDELCQYLGVDGGQVMDAAKLLMSSLSIKVPPSDPAMYVRTIGSRLGVDWDVIKEALKIIRNVRRRGRNVVVGKNPISLAAAAIYMAALARGKGITIKDVAKAVGMSRTTIRRRYRELLRLMRGDASGRS